MYVIKYNKELQEKQKLENELPPGENMMRNEQEHHI
jgi:hypothetical protein